jgi:integration host factor subunit alpha
VVEPKKYSEIRGIKMTKADIFEKVQNVIGISKKESAEMVEAVFAIMKNTLESGENLKISGFGSFIVKEKADRRGRNPQTGETITIEARRILSFKPSTVLRQAINR